MDEKIHDLREFLGRLESHAIANGALKTNIAQAWKNGVCASCLQPALENCYSEDGRKEYRISGLCEKFFDEATKEEK